MTVPPSQSRYPAPETYIPVVDELAQKLGRPPGRDLVSEKAHVGSGKATKVLRAWEQHGGMARIEGSDSGVVPTAVEGADRVVSRAVEGAGRVVDRHHASDSRPANRADLFGTGPLPTRGGERTEHPGPALARPRPVGDSDYDRPRPVEPEPPAGELVAGIEWDEGLRMASPQVEAEPEAGRPNPLFTAWTTPPQPRADPQLPLQQERVEAPVVGPTADADRTEPLRPADQVPAASSDGEPTGQPTAVVPAESSPAAAAVETRERRTGWKASVGGAMLTLGLVAVVAVALVVALRLLNAAPGWLGWLTDGPGWWHTLLPIGGVVVVLLATGSGLLAVAPKRTVEVQAGSPLHAKGWYAMFAGALFLSGDTSARYFTQVLHFHVWETAVVFLLIEIGLLSAALEMRDILTRDTSRAGLGKARALLWTLFGGQAIVAVALNIDPRELVVRLVFAGFGLLAIHQALGVDVREARRHSGDTAELSYLGRLLRELRDAVLSWTGLGEPERDALQRRRERAADRYARLLSEGKPQGEGERRWSAAARWTRKVRRARRRANLHDPAQQARVVRVMQHERADDELMSARLPKLFNLPSGSTMVEPDRSAVAQSNGRPWRSTAG